MAFLTAGSLFQHTAARRRLATKTGNDGSAAKVSTHSRPKAAGYRNNAAQVQNVKFQHTAARRRLGNSVVWCRTLNMFQHTAARRRLVPSNSIITISILFQHTAARRRLVSTFIYCNLIIKFQHTAARRRLEMQAGITSYNFLFQHTAARRRLDACSLTLIHTGRVSTHSRPKAAGGSG